jgi:hypothetical protein
MAIEAYSQVMQQINKLKTPTDLQARTTPVRHTAQPLHQSWSHFTLIHIFPFSSFYANLTVEINSYQMVILYIKESQCSTRHIYHSL